MELPEFPVTPAAREYLADFGEVMLQVQLFEFTLLGLVNAQEESGQGTRGADKNLRRIESLFTSTAGQLRNRAKITDEEFGDLLEQAVDLRNRLVHHWLIMSAIESYRQDEATYDRARSDLAVAGRSLQLVRERLQSLFDEVLGEQGRQPITPEELRSMLAPREPQ